MGSQIGGIFEYKLMFSPGVLWVSAQAVPVDEYWLIRAISVLLGGEWNASDMAHFLFHHVDSIVATDPIDTYFAYLRSDSVVFLDGVSFPVATTTQLSGGYPIGSQLYIPPQRYFFVGRTGNQYVPNSNSPDIINIQFERWSIN